MDTRVAGLITRAGLATDAAVVAYLDYSDRALQELRRTLTALLGPDCAEKIISLVREAKTKNYDIPTLADEVWTNAFSCASRHSGSSGRIHSASRNPGAGARRADG